jgi:hypothetical protein
VIALAGGRSYKTCVASALFLGGGAIFAVAGLANGGTGRRNPYGSPQAQPDRLPFSWVFVGLLVIGAGVIAAIL